MKSRETLVRIAADVVATVICALGALFTLSDVHSPVRSGTIAAALVLGAGWAATCWVKVRDAALAATIAMATGLSLFCFYALLFVEIGWWHPINSVRGFLAAAALLNLLALAWDISRRVRA